MPKKDGGAGDALFSGEQELRLLVERIPALVWRAGPEGDVEYVNKGVLEYFGAPLGDIIGWGWAERVHPDDVAFKTKTWLRNLESGTAHDAACRFRGADGRYRWFLVSGAPLKDDDGRVLHWYGVLIDIDDRRRAEEALRASEHKLRQIIDTVPSLTWSTGPDNSAGTASEERPKFLAQLRAILNVLPALTWYAPPSGGLTFVSKRQGDFLGLPTDHPLRFGIDIGVPWDAHIPFLHPDDQEMGRKHWSNSLRTGQGYEYSYRVRDIQGKYRWLLTRTEPLRASDGTLQLWVGATFDIEELKRAEQALCSSEAYLAEAQKLSHTGSFGWTPSTGELHWSDETFRILEYDPSIEPTIERVLQRVHPDDRAMVRQLIEETSSGEKDFDVVHRLQMPDGSVKFVHVLSHALKDAAGDLEIVGALMDVTENKLLYRDLAEREARLVAQAAELRRSEAYLAEAQRLSHSGVAAYNETMILYGSDETFRIWGFDPAEGVPSREAVFQRIHPDDRDRLNAEVQRAVGEKRRYSIGYRIVLPDGTVKHLETIGQPAFSASGELAEIVTTQIDVTERKHAEDLLRRSEANLAEAQRLSHTGAVTYNGTAILYASEETYRIWGFDPAQGVPSREAVFQRIHRGDLDRLNVEVRRAVGEKREFSVGYRIVLPDGTVKHLDTIGKPVFSANGKLVEIVATQTDVTERKRAEERLRAQHTVAQILAEAATIEEATPRILLSIGECLGWDVGVLWRVDQEAGVLRCVELWHEASIEVPEFERVSRAITFGAGLGLPGRVWSRLEPQYIPDVVPDENFPRAPIAEREGLRAAFGFPILLGGEVLGVIEFFSREIRQPDQELLNVLATIGSQIGQFIERKLAEEGLRESEAKFRDYAETASDWFWETDPDHKFTRLTEDERRLARGFATVSRIGVPRWEFATDVQSEPEKWELHRSILEARQPFRDFVYRATRSDESVVYNKISGKPVFDANGEFRGYRGTGADVTEIIRAQEALRESERRSSSTLDGIAGLITVNDANGKLDTVNRQVLEYFGRSLEYLKEWGTNDVVHPEDLPRIFEIYKRATASGIPFTYEVRLRRFDGEYRWFDNRGVPIRDDSGRVVRWYVLLTDIDDRIQALARLDQMQSDLAHMNRVSVMGEMAASLSHEITQPIATARNNARAALNFLDKQPPDLDEVREALHAIVGDADRAKDIIDRIRDQIKKAPARKSRFDLSEAINEVILLARSAITANGVSVRTRLVEELFPVEGDRVQLQQVVLNLILNAVEAMSTLDAGPRELLISTKETQAGGVLVSVRDSGPGLDPDHLDRVFQAFYTTKSSGVGMGLSICRSIVDAHGGRLWAGANEPRGAVFQFTLPGAEKKLTNPLPASRQTGKRHEDTASDPSHQPAYEGNTRPHHPTRESGRRRWGRQ